MLQRAHSVLQRKQRHLTLKIEWSGKINRLFLWIIFPCLTVTAGIVHCGIMISGVCYSLGLKFRGRVLISWQCTFSQNTQQCIPAVSLLIKASVSLCCAVARRVDVTLKCSSLEEARILIIFAVCHALMGTLCPKIQAAGNSRRAISYSLKGQKHAEKAPSNCTLHKLSPSPPLFHTRSISLNPHIICINRFIGLGTCWNMIIREVGGEEEESSVSVKKRKWVRGIRNGEEMTGQVRKGQGRKSKKMTTLSWI